MNKPIGMFKLRKIVSMVLTMALIVTMLPLSFQSVAEAANGANFIFPNEKYDAAQPRITSNDRVDLSGSIVGVKESSITYTVSRILTSDGGAGLVETAVESKPEQTANISVNGTSISVKDIQLYTGLNRITFKGISGISEVYDSVYIEYRNGLTLQDLKVTTDNISPLNLEEDKATVVASAASKGKDTADIVIMGVAKNADKVQITIDGKSSEHNVTNTTSGEFSAGPIGINKGTNKVTIRAYNSTQSVETTRMITFSNGNVTFYNVNLIDASSNKVDITTTNKIMDTAAGYKTIKGQVAIPTSSLFYDASNKLIKPTVHLKINAASAVPLNVTNITYGTPTTTFDFEYNPSKKIVNAGRNELEFSVNNISTAGLPNAVTSAKYTLNVTDQNTPFFNEANHLDSYDETMGTSQVLGLTGVTLDGAKLATLPTALEFIVANGAAGDKIDISSIKNSSGTAVSYTAAQLGFDFITSEPTTITVGGGSTSATRYIYKVSKLPVSGVQTIRFQYGGNSNVVYDAKLSLVYGPYHKYNSIYDGMNVTADTSVGNGWKVNVVQHQLGGLKGKVFNVPGKVTLDDKNTFLYLNNVRLPLNITGNNIALKDIDAAAAALTMGENKVRFVFRTDGSYYKSEITVTVLPKSLPTVDNMFPYGLNQKADPYPTPNNSLFEHKGGIYYTNESELNVYGSFDFLDIVNEDAPRDHINPNNYKVTIKSPTLGITYNWSLNDAFTIVGGGGVDKAISGKSYDGLTVIYDRSTKNFSFFIQNVKMPTNGSMVMFTVNVESNLTTAQAELTIMPLHASYTVVKPLSQKRQLNQNYVEVIINAEGADKVIINKKELKKEQYTELTASGDKVFEDAFRTTISGLKANKDTKIEFSIVRGDDIVKDSFTVRYVPTNIPGAQYMETLKNTHKVFDGALNLSLEKGTSLIRKDYNVSEPFKNQVYTNHNIMFAIANPEDGVVDQHEFETLPPDYDFELSLGETIFTESFPKRFVKSSPVFWIDPGLADDLNTTTEYDPVTYGSDPYQFPSPYSEIASFYNRDSARELIPSKVGSLTLQYDSNATTDAGRLITVFRFDPQLKQWENIGGVVNEKKHTVTVPFSRFGYYVVAKMSYSYTDVVNHGYARDFIETLFAKGVMNPDQPDTAFGTDMNISRGEFTRMIVAGLQIPLDYEGPKHFSDLYVPDDASMNDINANGLWDFRYIETAARKGIVRGIAPNLFGEYNDLQRQDAAVMIAKALNLKLETDRTKIDKNLRKLFEDADSIDYYAKASVLAIAKKGFITGVAVDPSDPKTAYVFNPEQFMLRSDAALIIGRVMNSNKMLPKM